ncbi:MAG: thiamine ABC transporter substrate-binding protein, partial [Ardenticatenales bacterium]|nr:thiamine ABC transporter substrate-binding protein [Ardenticatenales bacterium]
MKKSNLWLLLLLLVGTLLLVACGGTQTGGGTATPESAATMATDSETESSPEAQPSGEKPLLRVVTHDSFAISAEVLDAFQKEHNVTVEFVPLGDTGSMVNQSILSVNNPLGDVMYGVDNTFLTRALVAEIFDPYESPNLAQVDAAFLLDAEHRVTPADYGDVCLNYDIAYFEEAGLAPPASLEDLVKEEYRGMTVVQNPATSSPGLAFLLATVNHFGAEGWQEYWATLQANEVLVTSGWSEAYFGQFTAGGGEGTYP